LLLKFGENSKKPEKTYKFSKFSKCEGKFIIKIISIVIIV